MPGVMETVSKQAEIIPRDFYLMRIAALPEINKIAKYFIRNKIPVSDGDYSRNLKITDQCQWWTLMASCYHPTVWSQSQFLHNTEIPHISASYIWISMGLSISSKTGLKRSHPLVQPSINRKKLLSWMMFIFKRCCTNKVEKHFPSCHAHWMDDSYKHEMYDRRYWRKDS